MKQVFLFLLTLVLISCNKQVDRTEDLQKRVDSLKLQLAQSYRPGFGEFMSSIQVHHNKLWFAGVNQNWKLADFEINEIKESLDGITTYCKDRPETKSIAMIEPPLEHLSASIVQKNLSDFKANYIALTNVCNDCHGDTGHEYNQITIPTIPPYSNQIFKLADGK